MLKTVDDFERPGSAGDAPVELLCAITIKPPGNSRFSGGTVVEKEVLSLSIHATRGQQHIDTVPEPLSPARTALDECLRLLIADRKFCAVHLRTLARDDIDDGKHGILAVYRATRSGNEFDALDQVHVDWEFPTGRS